MISSHSPWTTWVPFLILSNRGHRLQLNKTHCTTIDSLNTRYFKFFVILISSVQKFTSDLPKSGLELRTFFILLSNFALGTRMLCLQPTQRIRISIPILMISISFVPQG